jgi:hypothetical protein
VAAGSILRTCNCRHGRPVARLFLDEVLATITPHLPPLLLLEMQEQWLATRIKRDDYGWIGDLRALETRATEALEVKTHWGRAHAALASRMAGWKASGDGPGVSVVMRQRADAVWRALGSRAEEASKALADLRMPSLPPLAPRRALARVAARVNVLRTPTLEARRALSDYRRATEPKLRGWQLWRLNPISLAWNGARDLKNLAIFVANMTGERY